MNCKTMRVIRQKRIYRQDMQYNKRCLYIFGDNLDRRGFGGQAKEMRGEPNAFGIATKRSISHNYPQDYFFDNQLDTITILEREFRVLDTYLEDRKDDYDIIVIPLDGIGTGLAQLEQNAPNALAYIEEQFDLLESKYNEQ